MPLGPGPRSKSTIATSGLSDIKFSSAPAALSLDARTFMPRADSAAESVVKRADNKDKFSIASVFKQKGYSLKYMYGGDAFFDNMGDFFSGNGYDIIDKKTFKPQEITFSNIWGVCDEDMYNKAIKVMNSESKQNKPFYNHIMTVSNHRPFTYPEGKVDISPKIKSRDGGVKYTDYALNRFFDEAKKEPWFNNTIFVMVADHCNQIFYFFCNQLVQSLNFCFAFWSIKSGESVFKPIDAFQKWLIK
jgi:phosphoglycerol transferase MdoB-like AlkP superfamily enzyme